MKKKNKKFLHAEDAQSTVIGFVLIMGIVLSASSIYFATQVPEWTKDYESRHTADVADDFSELKVLVDGIKGETFERTTTVKMSPDKVPILGMSPPGSNLVFEPEAEKFEVIVPVGGGGGGSGNWTIPNSGFSDYYDGDNSSRVSVSDDEVMLSSPTTTTLILDDTTMELSGDLSYPEVHYYDEVIIRNNSILSVTNASGVLRVYADNITLDASSKIDADCSGNLGGDEAVRGSGTGSGGPAEEGSHDGGGGAGYGGIGGAGGRKAGGGKPRGGDGGVKYGDATSIFTQIGSGGGGGGGKSSGIGGSGGTGGGGVWLDAKKIVIDGTISANGAEGGDGSGLDDAGGGGGGSGGGILIRGRNVTISDTATLSANGGDGGDGYDGGYDGGGGGGGRIKVFYELGTIDETDWSAFKGQGGAGKKRGKDGKMGSNETVQIVYITTPTEITYYSSGYFVSTVYDTGNDGVHYGEMTWDATLNGQDLVMKIRTDWTESMTYATPWDDCPELSSDDGENKMDLSGVGSVSPVAHRYIQYRAELSTADNTKTPVLPQFKVNYSFPAQSPVLANATGSIKFKSNYLHYPNQEIVYEHGAVIKYQREGGFMLQEPPIIISNESGIPAIKISLVDLTGGNYSYSGATSTAVKTSYQNYELLADGLKYPNLGINISTEYPSVWGNWFNKKFAETTLTTLHDYNVSVNATAKTVAVELYGHEHGVELYLEKTAVEVEI